MAKMATTSATKFMVLAVHVAIMLLIFTEVATAAVDNNAKPELKLGLSEINAIFVHLFFPLAHMFHLACIDAKPSYAFL